MKPSAKLSIVGVLLAVLAAILYPSDDAAKEAAGPGQGQEASQQEPAKDAAADAKKVAPKPQESERAAPKPQAPKPETQKPKTPTAPPAASAELGGLPPSTSKVGFTSRRSWESHFEKHGHEFGKINADQYLARAKALRDAPPSADILQHKREVDGVYCRFHKPSGGFIAYHEDKTIRTYFRPNDGEAYYRRQLERRPDDGR